MESRAKELWNAQRKWVFKDHRDAQYGLDTSSPTWTSIRPQPRLLTVYDELMSLQMTSSQSRRVETLKVSLDAQKSVIQLVENQCLVLLRTEMEEASVLGLNVTFAQHTRYNRLLTLVKVMKDMEPLQLSIIAWIEGMPAKVPHTMLYNLQDYLSDVEKATNKMPTDWQIHQDRAMSQLETDIAGLHKSVEGLLAGFGLIIKNILHNDSRVNSIAPCNISMSDLSLLHLKLPHKYILED